MNKVTTFSLIVTLSIVLSACGEGSRSIQGLFNSQPFALSSDIGGTGSLLKVAAQLESAADNIYSRPFSAFKKPDDSSETDLQSCDVDDTAIVTIYSTNGQAQNEIDVMLDGNSVGSLKTYYPSDEPSCKTPTEDGVITLKVPSGKHTIEATSSNITWPSRDFSVEKCWCMVLPLS